MIYSNKSMLQQVIHLFIKKNRTSWKATRLLKMLFIISGIAMTWMLSLRGSISFIAIGMFFSSMVLFIMTYKFSFIEKAFINLNKVQLIISAMFTLYANHEFIIDFQPKFAGLLQTLNLYVQIPAQYNNMLIELIPTTTGWIASIAVFTFIYIFINRSYSLCKDWFSSLDKIDRNYLIICGIVFSISVVVIFGLTNVFYAANTNGNLINYDVIYTTDSANQLSTNVYLNINAPENDIRQPLFGLFALPFALFAMLISKWLFFVPNIYPIAMNIIQILLLLVSLIMVSKMLKLKGLTKALFLGIITLTYPTILFSINMEQYVFALFWLIMLVYSNLKKKDYKDFYYIAATGSMLTSGIMFPLLSYEKNIKNWIKDMLRAFIKFFAFLSIFGQLPLILDSMSSINSLMGFAGAKLGYPDKMLQFFNFVISCFIKPHAGINTTTYSHISYQLEPITTLNYIGISIFIIAILGFLLNYKNRFAKICMVWITYSFALLFLIGWGTVENGLILYTLYFAWAYISLVFMFIERVFKKYKIFRYSIYSVALLFLLYINLPAIYEIIIFGIKYYPTR